MCIPVRELGRNNEMIKVDVLTKLKQTHEKKNQSFVVDL